MKTRRKAWPVSPFPSLKPGGKRRLLPGKENKLNLRAGPTEEKSSQTAYPKALLHPPPWSEYSGPCRQKGNLQPPGSGEARSRPEATCPAPEAQHAPHLRRPRALPLAVGVNPLSL